jgi:hypothetical protein
LMLRDLNVLVVNSQEYARQLEMLRQLALENNTSGATLIDLAHIITSNSIGEIKKQLQESVEYQQQMQQQKIQNEQQQLQIQQQIAQLKEQKADERQDKELANKLEVERIRISPKMGDTGEDDSQKLDLQQQQINNDQSANQRKHELEIQKQIDQKQLAYDQLAMKNKEIDARLQIQDKKLQETRILKGMKNKETPKKK